MVRQRSSSKSSPSKRSQSDRIFPHIPQRRLSSLHHGNDPLNGFVNLTFLILISATLNLILRNIYQHGILLDISFIYCIWGDLFGAAIVIFGMIIYSFITFILIKILIKNYIGIRSIQLIYTIIQLLLYIIPIRIVFIREMAPLMGGSVATILVIISLKIHSYFATNLILYKLSKREKKRDIRFPANITIFDFIYFLSAPTLVYETYYPRNEKIRYLWAFKQIILCIICLALGQLAFAQFMHPILVDFDNSKGLFHDILRLSIPSIIAWLLGFYAFFHCYLNFLAELLCFGDREFYRDWWNAPSLDIFWRKWNILVHEWLLRHVYLESLRTAKQSQKTAIFWTFLFSAVYHELIFFVAFRVLRPWFFLAMFLQYPMIIISRLLYSNLNEKYRDFIGNINVWLGFFIGQPLILLLYIREWFLVSPSLSCIPETSVVSWF